MRAHIRATSLLVVSLAGGWSSALALAACGGASTHSANSGPVHAEPAGEGTGVAFGPFVRGSYSVPSGILRNTGTERAVVEAVDPIWDTDQGRPRGGYVGSFLVGKGSDLSWGEEKGWPPSDLYRLSERRRIPGAELQPGEEGVVWVGVRAPSRGAAHLVGFAMTYRVHGITYRAELVSGFWFCRGKTRLECHAIINAAG